MQSTIFWKITGWRTISTVVKFLSIFGIDLSNDSAGGFMNKTWTAKEGNIGNCQRVKTTVDKADVEVDSCF